jgi:hypothetical protein
MKKSLSGFLLLLTICGVIQLTLVSTPVKAQGEVGDQSSLQVEETSTPTTEEQLNEGEALTQPSVEAELEALRITYRSQLEAYRDQERQHSIAKEQYAQLKTLASLEAAVVTTRQVLITRAEVLDTYLTILRLTLQAQPGIDVSRKERLLIELDSLRQSLGQHKAQVEQVNERIALAQVAQEFTPLGASIETKSYHVQSVIALGRLQTVFDKSLSLSSRMKEQSLSETSTIQQSRRERAFSETERTADSIRQQLIANELEVQKEEGYSRSQYTRFSGNLGSVYANVSQFVSYLEEILTL